jgi:two-component system response regulator RegX3
VRPLVLVVEDEPPLQKLLAYNLEAAGFETAQAFDGEEAVTLIEERPPDLLILDWMLPQLSGIELCRRLRRRPETAHLPIIMLTARGEEHDRLRGLETGANDFVTKPFSPAELIARVRAVLRRGGEGSAEADGSPGVLEAGPVRMDVERHVVAVNGTDVPLPLKEFDLLEYLLRNVGRVLTRGQLIDRVWGADYVGDTKTLDVHVKRLRGKVELDPSTPKHLVTVRGLGYKFET